MTEVETKFITRTNQYEQLWSEVKKFIELSKQNKELNSLIFNSKKKEPVPEVFVGYLESWIYVENSKYWTKMYNRETNELEVKYYDSLPLDIIKDILENDKIHQLKAFISSKLITDICFR